MRTLQEKLEDARRDRREAEAKLTDSHHAEIALRDELAAEEKAAREAREKFQALELEQRLDAAKEVIGGVGVRALQIVGTNHNFILKNPGGAAYNIWMGGLSAKATADINGGKGPDRAATHRAFAAHAVHDWNGATGFDSTSSGAGRELNAFLTDNPAIVSEIVTVAAELAKEAAAARKAKS